MKTFKILLFCFIVASCNMPRAVYDYDSKLSFKQYSTYGLFPEFNSGLNQLDEKRLVNTLESQLKKEGFTKSDEPHIYVNVYTEKYLQNNQNTLGVGIGGTGRNVGVGVSGGIPLGGPDTYLRLTFDFIDVKTDSLIWQAIVENRFDKDAKPNERLAWFNKVVEKALEGYPPVK